MRDNLIITARKRGKLVTRRSLHNTWTVAGRALLAAHLGFASLDPDVTEVSDTYGITLAPKFIGFGIGGVGQSQLIPVPVATAYPAGSDPNATTGNTYDDRYPLTPTISTLERPVRVDGGTNPYGTAAGTDQWVDELRYSFSPSAGSVSYVFTLGTAFTYGSFSVIPLSEVGLFMSNNVEDGVPFQTVSAYKTFDTIPIDDDTELDAVWTVRFA